MKCKIVILVLNLVIGTSCSVNFAELLHQLPAYPDPFFCVLQSGTQPNTIQNVFEVSLKNGQQQMVITSNNFTIPSKKCTHFIVTFDNESWDGHTRHQFNHLFKHLGWNNMGYFVFFSGSDFSSSMLTKYGVMMQLLGITKSVLIFSDFQSFGYLYFEHKFLKFTTTEEMIGHLRKDHLLDVHGYVLRISVTNFYLSILITYNPLTVKGTTALFFEAFAGHLNATIDWLVQNWHASEFNDLIMRNKIEIITNQPFQSSLIDHVYENQYQGTVLLVPEKMRESFFNQLLIPYKTTLWIFLVLSAIVFMTLNNILKRHLTRNMMLMIFFGSATAEHDLPRIERFVFHALTIVMFLLSESYLARMFSFILNVQYEPHLETLEDFERTTLPVCTNFEINDSYRYFVQNVSAKLLKRLIHRTDAKQWYDISACSWLVFNQMAEAFLEYKFNYDPITMRKKLYMLPQILGWQPAIHSISRLGPFVRRYELTYRWLSEAGLFQHWKEDTNLVWVQHKWNSLTVLGWHDLLSLWYILGIGFALSSVVFLGEFCVKILEKLAKHPHNFMAKICGGKSKIKIIKVRAIS